MLDEDCLDTAPSPNGECNFFPCPTWTYAPWSDCSAQCGYGTLSRAATCTRYDGTALPDSACAASAQEPLSAVCALAPCPHWHRSVWGDCSLPCGSGNQTRAVSCRMPHDSVYEGMLVSSTLCPTSGPNIGGDGPGAAEEPLDQVPAAVQACNEQRCPAFYWQFRPTSACSVQCGGGLQEGVFDCHSGATHAVVSDDLCPSNAQPPVPACNPAPCTDSHWAVTSPWSECNVTCGLGVQLRNLSCLDGAGAVVDDTECELLPMPAVQQACTIDPAVCYGGGGAAGYGEVNGACLTATGACLCRPGWAGATCDTAPALFNVTTGAAGFEQGGVPIGDTLTVQWMDSGSVDYVSVLLVRLGAADGWPVAQYLAQQLPNYGAYQWTVGSLLGDLESGNYSVRVWFSDSAWADSAPFAVADPCGYVACSEHGTCSKGQCLCTPGFSGSDCSLGPCDSTRCNWEHAEACNALDHFTYDAAGAITGSTPGHLRVHGRLDGSAVRHPSRVLRGAGLPQRRRHQPRHCLPRPRQPHAGPPLRHVQVQRLLGGRGLFDVSHHLRQRRRGG